MRNRLGKWLVTHESEYESLLLLSGDIGFGIFDEFREKASHKFVNCGIAEQNMIGTAAGLAAKNFKPLVYTIIPFLLYRPFDFVRNLIAHQNLPVTLIGVGGGFSYDNLGFTHYAVEDLALARTLPNFVIYTPFDPTSAEFCFKDAIDGSAPAYIRLMKGGEPELGGEILDGMNCLCDLGGDYQIYCHGSIAVEALEAAERLNKLHKLRGKVFAVWKISLASEQILFQNPNSFFLEEHIYPGLFDGMAQPSYQVFAANRNQATKVGKRNQILAEHGLSAFHIAKHIANQLSNKNSV